MGRTSAGLRPVGDSAEGGGVEGEVLGQEVSVFEDLLRKHKSLLP